MAKQASELRIVAEGHALAISEDKERQERLEHDSNELAQLEAREVTHHRKQKNHTDEYRHGEGHG
jgi:hypothetical protein